jgi:flagellar motor protein MotB
MSRSLGSLGLSVLVPVALLSGCGVSMDKYNALKDQNAQLQMENQQLQQHVGRLQQAIKYTVNSDLLFAPGSWEMSDRGKDIIAKMAHQLAAQQQDKLMVTGFTDNAPIGPALKREGVTTNQQLSEKRAQTVAQYMISQGVKPNLIAYQGKGDQDPVATNDTREGRAANRRVEITLAGATM